MENELWCTNTRGEEIKRVNVEHNKFYGDGNYGIRPKAKEAS